MEGNLQSNLHITRPIGVANTRTSRRGLRYYANQLTKDLQQLYRTSAMCGPCHSPLNNYGVHFITATAQTETVIKFVTCLMIGAAPTNHSSDRVTSLMGSSRGCSSCSRRSVALLAIVMRYVSLGARDMMTADRRSPFWLLLLLLLLILIASYTVTGRLHLQGGPN